MRTLERLQTALTDGGISFIPAGGDGGPGVRWSHPRTGGEAPDAQYPTARAERDGYAVCEDAGPAPAVTALQMKLARTALGLGVRDLAAEAGVAPSTVQRFESEKGEMQARTLERVQQVLEDGGVVFIPADAGGGPGLRWRAEKRG